MEGKEGKGRKDIGPEIEKDSFVAQPNATVKSHAVIPSERSSRVHYAIRDIMLVADEAQRAGKQLLRLNIGDPPLYDFPTPRPIIEAAYQAMLAGHNGYAPSTGVEEALRAIRAHAERDGIRNIQDVFVSSGVSEAIEVCFAALLDPGDNVLIPSPGYPLYEAALVNLGGEPSPTSATSRTAGNPISMTSPAA